LPGGSQDVIQGGSAGKADGTAAVNILSGDMSQLKRNEARGAVVGNKLCVMSEVGARIMVIQVETGWVLIVDKTSCPSAKFLDICLAK
jgi:hypothetical protein